MELLTIVGRGDCVSDHDRAAPGWLISSSGWRQLALLFLAAVITAAVIITSR